jgi:hypothetical protein
MSRMRGRCIVIASEQMCSAPSRHTLAIHDSREHVVAGGLMSYGTSYIDT